MRDALKSVLRFLLKRVLLKPLAISIGRRLAKFEAMTHDPQRVQEAVLRDILTMQANTDFGRDHHFASMKTVADFRHNVPVAGYEAVEPYMARVLDGQTNALLSDPHVFMFALTSGTTATRKFIPVTKRYIEDYKHSWHIWGLKVLRDHKEVTLRPILQMAGNSDEMRSKTGVPCGAVTGLTASMQKRIIRWLYSTPPGVAGVKDPQAKYYTVMRLSLPRPVGMVIAANPSTMLNLARAGDQHKELLIRDVHDGTLSERFDVPAELRLSIRLKPNPARAKELEEVVRRTGTLYPKDAWTKPFVMGNWTGGSVGAYLRHYPRYFGENWVRDVGLIASEGRMTIPFADGTSSGVLDISSHYFEFVPEADILSPNPTVLGAHELVEGGRYFILLTTGYGLYRYNIHDLVRCTGHFNKTPLIEFLSKGSLFANMTGEKLSEYHVTQSMGHVLRDLGVDLSTYSVAPVWSDDDAVSPCYGLFIEQGELGDTAQRLAQCLDERLCQTNIEYEAKRSSARLGPVRLEVVPAGFWARWDRARLERTGGTLEQYKHPCLISDMEFHRQTRV